MNMLKFASQNGMQFCYISQELWSVPLFVKHRNVWQGLFAMLVGHAYPVRWEPAERMSVYATCSWQYISDSAE